ncbi:unnamed protein product [Leptidea sinapis]|uniref:Uncharacterized protein n=1 Tax=Leptidea sinapis TaxID=189913 RepID=A0A5E4Q363_9NEOP|nr:unnamed protein product [Leptidea sinapis]
MSEHKDYVANKAFKDLATVVVVDLTERQNDITYIHLLNDGIMKGGYISRSEISLGGSPATILATLASPVSLELLFSYRQTENRIAVCYIKIRRALKSVDMNFIFVYSENKEKPEKVLEGTIITIKMPIAYLFILKTAKEYASIRPGLYITTRSPSGEDNLGNSGKHRLGVHIDDTSRITTNLNISRRIIV